MQISAKDKKLLVYLLAIGIIALAYFFVAAPLLEKQSIMSDEINNLQMQVNHYNDIYMNRESYESRTAEAQIKYNETVNKFFGGLNQDNTIMLVKDLESTSGVWISRISFQDESIVYGGEENSEEVSSEDTITEENVEESTGTLIKGFRQDLNIDYSAKYDDFKRFIDYIENYNDRLFITSINASYAVDSGLVGGTIVLSQFAVTGTDKEYTAPDLSNVKLGNESIFKTGVSLLAPQEVENTGGPSDNASEEAAEENQTSENSNSENSSEANSQENVNDAASDNQNVENAPAPVMEEGDNGSGRRRLSR